VNNPASQTLSYQWSRNGTAISGANAATYSIPSAQAAQVGTYTVTVTAGTTTLQSSTALLELNATTRPVGDSVLFASDIRHPNGNVYDQFLLNGTATVITADPGQVARISFIDANDDIVQVEYSGSGTLTLQLANATGPAVAVNYNQATVSYMKGTPTITIAGADQTSNLGIFSVGSVTGNPAVLKSGVTYDGFANVALITISSANGQFGGVRIGNALLAGSSGNVGLVATGVNFTGPIVIGDIDASGTASPKFLTGTVAGLAGFPGEIRIAGGDLLQTNGRALEFGTATGVRMGAGTNAHGVSLPEKTVAGRLERNGQNVTSTVVPAQQTSNGTMVITKSTTNFDDGYTSSITSNFVQVTKNEIEVRLYYVDAQIDRQRPSNTSTFESYYWDAIVKPGFNTAQPFVREKEQFSFGKEDIWEATVTNKVTGKAGYLGMRLVFNNGSCRPIVVIAPDRNTYNQLFGTDDDFLRMLGYNKFAVAQQDLIGKWKSFEASSIGYYSLYTGDYAGLATASTNDDFVFSSNGSYESTHSGTSTFKGSVSSGTSNYRGVFTVNDWNLTASNRGADDPGEFSCQFEALKGGFLLRLVNKKFSGQTMTLFKSE
jgi:hypothetical protein